MRRRVFPRLTEDRCNEAAKALVFIARRRGYSLRDGSFVGEKIL